MKRAATNTDVKQGADLLEGKLTRRIIKCLYRVYDALGYGFLESVYQRAMLWELRDEGLSVESEAVVEAWYNGRKIGHFRVDLLVEGRVILENKASEILPMAGRKKLLNYLRSSTVEVGLLLHFGPKPRFQRLIYTNERKAHRPRSE